jgi:hypothetical protein
MKKRDIEGIEGLKSQFYHFGHYLWMTPRGHFRFVGFKKFLLWVRVWIQALKIKKWV